MRKSILVGLGLALTVAGTAVAQQPQDGQRGRRGGERAGRVDGRRGGPDGLLLKNITLSEQQRVQIAQLRKAQRAEMRADREKNRAQFEAIREARQRGDTAAVRKAFEARRVAMQQEREQHIAGIRNLLTAEQRVQFDQNVAELKTRLAQRAERVRKGEHRTRAPRGGVRGPGGR
jgi:Spy/CpxP family protein refolding chaperone